MNVTAVRFEVTIMKKTITLALDDAELIELLRILMDKDAEGALAFLQQHVRGKVQGALEGG
jgi:hypothetical protein